MADKALQKKGLSGYLPYKVAANAVISYGDIVATNATGYLVPASDTAAMVVVGIAEEAVDATGLADGEIEVIVYRGGALVANGAAGLALTQADVGRDCFIENADTVRKTDGTATANNVAGEVLEVTSAGVWVNFTGPR